MNILLTNDDGYEALGLQAAFEALAPLGKVHVVAPNSERSACGHSITMRRPITAERRTHPLFGPSFAIDGTPADCVRLAFSALIEHPIDLVVSGINHGANAGVDTFYSGTVAGAREAAILGIKSMAVSQARRGTDPDWKAAREVCHVVTQHLLPERLPGPGFWNINFPAPIPVGAVEHIRRVPIAVHPLPMSFDRSDSEDGKIMQFDYGASYWLRDVTGPSDYSVVRDGEIAVTAIPLYGRF